MLNFSSIKKIFNHPPQSESINSDKIENEKRQTIGYINRTLYRAITFHEETMLCNDKNELMAYLQEIAVQLYQMHTIEAIEIIDKAIEFLRDHNNELLVTYHNKENLFMAISHFSRIHKNK